MTIEDVTPGTILAAFVQRWRRVEERLNTERQRGTDVISTQGAIEGLDDAFESALLHHRPAASSGLVEQQKILRRLKR